MKSKYDVERMKYSDLEGSVVVPTYQRRLVWSEKQKESFIDNISKGYPFGSILLYRYEGDKKLSLIDGLQRYSTLKEYKNNPAKYFAGFGPSINRIFENIEDGMDLTLSVNQRDDLIPKIESLLRKCLEEDNSDPFLLRDLIKKEISLYPTSHQYEDDLTRIQQDLLKDASNYLDLDDLVIPCVVFTGNEDQLPDVFANLNQGGTKLSKYQVLAAHWTKHDFKLSDSETGKKVLQKVIDRYERLVEKRDLVIEDFDPDEMAQSRRINLSEYCFALGELIVENVPVFWQSSSNAENDKSEDTFNVVGYLTTAIALGVDNRTINKLPDKKHLFQSEAFVDQLTDHILKEYSVIESEFEKWLRKPGVKVEYESGAIADMQALSFFAALWHKHYYIDGIEGELRSIEHYKDNGYDAARKNLIAYCVSDVASRTWQGSGDTRLANYYVETADTRYTYAVPMSEETLSNRLLAWYDEVSQRSSIIPEKVSKMLLCVFAAPDITKYSADEYDIEHVVSKKKLRANDIYKSQQIPGGALGNLMYLNPKTNRGKKEFNLYSLQENHEGVLFDEEYLKMIDYPPKKTIFNAEERLSCGEADAVKKMIDGRAKDMIACISKAVCN